MGTASASDINVNETQTLTSSNNDEIVSLDNTQETLSAGEPATFADLATDVGDGGDKNLGGKIYTYDSSSGGNTITITQSGTIDGQGAVIDANGAYFRLFRVGTDNVIFKNITFKNVNFMEEGPVILFNYGGTLEDCTFADNTAGSGAGGAVYFNGEGTVTNCNFTHNTASGNHAGALYFYDVGTVINSNFIDNSASGTTSGNGGAIYFNSRGTVINSNFTNNVAVGGGGAIFFASVADIEYCNFINNNVTGNTYAGGAVNIAGYGRVKNSNFTNNSASRHMGGAIHLYMGEVSDCDFTNNSAGSQGGAINFIYSGTVTDCNFTDNNGTNNGGAVCFSSSGTVTGSNFIHNQVSGSALSSGGGAVYFGSSGTVDNCNFTDNSESGGLGGGALFFGASTGEVTKSNFNNNHAAPTISAMTNDGGGAIFFSGNGNVEDCNFTDNYVNDNFDADGGAVYFASQGNVINCNFRGNNATAKKGGAVYFAGKGTVTDSDFIGNTALDGGAVYFNSTGNVTNSNFDDNTAVNATFVASHGGAVYFAKNGNVTKSNFTNNVASPMATGGGAIYFAMSANGNVTNSNFNNNRVAAGKVAGGGNSGGGAIYFSRLSTNIVDNCNFTDNLAYNSSGGGAIYVGTNAIVTNCNFTNNTAEFKAHGGGALYFSENGNVTNCNFINNSCYDAADAIGGAIIVYATSNIDMNINNCNFTNNSAKKGGAISARHTNVTNCNFTSNHANGGGAINFDAGYSMLTNCSFNNNSASNQGGVLNIAGSVDVNNCNFTDNFASSHGVITSNEGSYTNIINSKFENNRAVASTAAGAIYAGGSVNVVKSNFTNNSAVGHGGAIYFSAAGGYVDSCDFSDNIASRGGAINFNAPGTVINCNFTGNNASNDGGAVYFYSEGTVINCSFINNTVKNDNHHGGAVYIASGEVKDSNFTNNSAGGRGGAIYTKTASVDNCVFVNNTAYDSSYGGGAIYANGNSEVKNSNFTDNIAKHYGGAILFNGAGTVDNCNFNNNSASRAGAVYFYKKGSVNNSNFTYNHASTGSAISFISSSSSDTKSVKNSILLNNKADSKSLTINRNKNKINIVFQGNDDVINAIDSASNIDFDNVTYWGVNGVTNTGTQTISPSSNEAGQNITVKITHDGNVEEKKMVTGVNGNVSVELTEAGSYTIRAYHYDDSYYTEKSASTMPFDLYETVTDVNVVNFTAQALVKPNEVTGYVTFTVTNESGVVKEDTVPMRKRYSDGVLFELDLSDLNLGKYNITAVYNGDDNYLPSNDTTSFELKPLNSTILIQTENIRVGQSEWIEITINGKSAAGRTAYINGDPYDIINYYGYSYCIVDNLPEGRYLVEVSYEGDGKYLPAYNSSTFGVVEDKEYYVTAHNKTIILDYPVNITAESNIKHDILNGTMYFIIYEIDKGVDYYYDTFEPNWDGNGLWWFEFTFPSSWFDQDEIIIVEPYYEGLDYNVEYNNGYMIIRSPSPFNISAEDVDYGNKANVTIDLPFDVEGNITFYIGDKNYTIENIQGNPKYFIIPDILAAGQYNITAVYSGDQWYASNTSTTNFTVRKVHPTITINASDIVVGNNAIINATLPENATGKITIIVNHQDYEIDSGESISIPNLNVGTYEIVAIYGGDQNYTNAIAYESFNVINRNLNISLDEVTDKIYVGSPVTLTARLNETVTGEVIFAINGVNHTATISNANFTTFEYTPVDNSPLTVVATFPGNERFNSNKSNPIQLTVNGIPTNVTVSFDSPVLVGNDVEITITLNASIDTTVKLRINDTVRDVIISGGTGTYTASNLANDTYTISATFEGNEIYAGNTSEPKTLKVNKVPTNITVELDKNPIYVGETAVITINMNPNINAIVKLRINGKTYYVAVVNGVGSYNVSGLPANDGYDVNVTFDGDSKYIYSTNNTTLVVNKVSDYPLNVTTENIVFGDNETITVVLPADVDPTKLVIKVDGNEKAYTTFVNGVATLVVPGLTVGQHEVNVTYLGDDKYASKDNNSNIFTVSPSTICNIFLDVDNKTYGQDTTFTVTLPKDVTENVTITIDGIDYSRKPDSEGVATLTLNNLTGGLHAVTASYPGDNTYSSNSTSATFTIARAPTTIDVNFTTPKSVGDDVLINVSMGQKINGTVILSVGSQNYTVAIVNGNGSYVVSGLTNTTYDIKATFAGNENYADSSSGIKQLEINKVQTTIAVAVNSTINVGETAVVNVTINKKLNGSAIVTINGENHTVAIIDGNGTLVLTNLANGTYTINATFKGDDKYLNSTSADATLIVNKIATDIEVTVKEPVTYGEDAVISIELDAPINATVLLSVDGKEYNVGLINGKGGFNASGLSSGPHEVNVTYTGDTKYVGSNDTATFTVANATLVPDVIAQNVTVEQNTSFILDIDKEFKGNVSIKVGDKVLYNGTVKTVIEAAKLTAGDKNATVVFYGDSNYDELTIENVKFTVSRVAPDITVDIDDVTYPDKAVARVTVSNNANGTVNITVDGKVFNETVTNGEATVNLTGLGAGAKVAEVKFFTNDDYNDNTTATAKFNIDKADSNITISVESEYVYNETITIDLAPSFDGIVNVTVNGVVYPVANNQVVIDRIAAGDYTVIANLAGNANYTGASNSTTFKVKQAGSIITIGVESIYKVGNDIEITLNTENITDSDAISVTVNGVVYPVVNKVVTIAGGLPADEYIINAVLVGNENFTGSSANRTFNVVKDNITIDLDASAPIVVGTPVTFTATLGEEVTGDVVFTINGANYTVHVDNAKTASYEYTPVNNDTLTVVATFMGDDKYNGNSTTENFDVDRVATGIDVSVKEPVTYGEDAVISIELDAPVNATVILTIDGKEYNVGLVNGKGEFNASGLSSGPHQVNVTYAGDNKYIGSNDTAKFTVGVASLVADVIAQDVTVEQNTSFIIDVPDDFNGNVSITVDGDELYNGLANILVAGKILPIAGDKNATVVFYGDSNYDELTLKDVKFTVSSVAPAITVDIDDVTYPDKAVATVTVANNANGTVEITVDGKKFTKEVKNGEAVVNLTGLGAGAKVAEVKFITNDTYNDNASTTARFHINKADSNITIGVEPEYVYNETITIDLAPSFDGIVNVTVNGVVYPVKNNRVVIDRIAAGDYTVIANLAGNANYTGATNSTTFKVKQAGSNISIAVGPVYKVDEEVIIYLTTENITDVDAISVTVDGKSYDVRADGTVVISDSLKAGEHIINAILAGNQNYTGSSANASFEVIKLNTTISIYATSPREVGSPFDISAVLGSHVTGDVVFTINGVNYTVSLVDDWIAVFEYTPLNNDTVAVVATFMGDDKYNNISTSNNFDVNKVASTIEVTVKEPVTYGEDALISIELNAPINATVVLTVDGEEYNVALVNGKGSFNVSDLIAGPHEVNVTYAGDNKYIGSNDTATFNVEKADLTAKVTAQNVTVEQDTSFVIDVPDDFNGNVSITADNKELYNGPVNTIVDGSKLVAGDKTATVVFYGDNNYDDLTVDNVKFTVSRVTPEISAQINDVTYPDKAVATVAVANNANGTVEITVDGKKFTKEVKNGKATVDLTDLGAGDKVAEIKFITSDDYNDNASTTTKFTVNKADTPISLDVEEGVVGVLTNITVGVNAPGIVSVKVNDSIVYVGPVDGSVVIPVSGLTAGDYDVVATYYGDDNHKSNSTSDSFTVDKNSTYDFDATPSVENQTLIIDIDLPDDATGTITVTINDENITVPVTDTIAIDLEPGTYDVNVTYNGDDQYEPKTKELGEITIPTIDDYDIIIESNGTDLIITLPEDINGEVTVDIDGNKTTVPVVNGTAVVPIDDLEPGDHDVNVTYPGDEKYSPNSNETTINVPTIDDYDIIIESNGTDLIITLPEDINGEVTVDIDGNKTTVPVVNGTAVVPIDDLEPGDHDVNVTYPGDEKYSPNSNETTINVTTIDDYPFAVDAVVDGRNANITVTLPDDIDGVVLIDVDDVGYYANATNGEAKLHLSDLPNGIHNVTAKYLGDDKYSPKENSTSFKTNESITPEMDVTPDIPNKTLIVDLPDDATGNVIATIDGKNYTAPIVDGKAVIPLDDLEPGDYEAEVYYPGDNKYSSADENTTFTIPRIDDYDIDIAGDDDNIIITLPEDINGKATVNIDGKDYTVDVVNGTAVIPNVSPGNHDVTVTYPGDDKYAPKTANATVFIKGVMVIVDDLVKYYSGPHRLNVSVVDTNGKGIANKAVKITINGVTYNRKTNSNGLASLPVNLPSANYTAHVEVDEYRFSKDVNVEVRPTIFGTDVVKVFRNGTHYYGLFLDGYGNPLVNTNVSYNIHGVFYNRTTNATGWSKLNLMIEKGEYILTALNTVTGEMISNNITVYTQIETQDLVKYYRNDTQFICRVVAPDGSYAGAGERVDFNIHGRLYTRYTNETGHIKLNINIEPGTYSITSYYQYCREGNTIVVLPVLSADDLSMKYRDGSKFTAKVLDGQGNPYPNQVVTFNINGVFYNRTTDSNGEAKLNINLQPGKYIITSAYNECSISNKITITS